jgi:hypothetical protein
MGLKHHEILIWEGTHNELAQAVLSFQLACTSHTLTSKRWPIGPLFAETLEAAFLRILGVAPRSTREAFEHIFGRTSIAGELRIASRLHALLSDLAQYANDEFIPNIDTLREAIYFVSGRVSSSVVSAQSPGLKGSPRQLRAIVERGAFREWPYCELCYRLCVSAANAEKPPTAIGKLGEPVGQHRFCAQHDPQSGPAYATDHRRRLSFKRTLKDVLTECQSNPAFRQRVLDAARWPVEGAASAEAICKLAEADPVPLNPMVASARYFAYHIARNRPGNTTMQIAQLLHRGNKPSEVAKLLGVSRQSIYKSVGAMSGCFDFGQRLEALRWWPDSKLIGPHIFHPSINTRYTPEKSHVI